MSFVTSAAGAFTSTATFLTRPSFLPSAWLTTPSTPATPSNAAPPSVIRALTAAATGYLPPLTRRAAVAACALVIRSPAWKADHTRWLDAVVGGVHGRSAAAGAASTVRRTPLTVIRAPSMASTARTPPSFLSLPRSAWVSPPGTEAITSGTTRCVALAPASPGPLGAVPADGPPADGPLPDSPPAGTTWLFSASTKAPPAVPPAPGRCRRSLCPRTLRGRFRARQGGQRAVRGGVAAAEHRDGGGDGRADRYQPARDGPQRLASNQRQPHSHPTLQKRAPPRHCHITTGCFLLLSCVAEAVDATHLTVIAGTLPGTATLRL